jgi:hypothetical protein
MWAYNVGFVRFRIVLDTGPDLVIDLLTSNGLVRRQNDGLLGQASADPLQILRQRQLTISRMQSHVRTASTGGDGATPRRLSGAEPPAFHQREDSIQIWVIRANHLEGKWKKRL